MKHHLVSLITAGTLLGLVLPAAAASAAPTPVGIFAIASLGQGGWAGGPLYGDGTIGGGGAFSFGNGQEILRITGGTWAGSATSGVTICASVTAVKDPLGLAGAPLCLGPLAANAGPQLISGTLVKVSLR